MALNRIAAHPSASPGLLCALTARALDNELDARSGPLVCALLANPALPRECTDRLLAAHTSGPSHPEAFTSLMTRPGLTRSDLRRFLPMGSSSVWVHAYRAERNLPLVVRAALVQALSVDLLRAPGTTDATLWAQMLTAPEQVPSRQLALLRKAVKRPWIRSSLRLAMVYAATAHPAHVGDLARSASDTLLRQRLLTMLPTVAAAAAHDSNPTHAWLDAELASPDCHWFPRAVRGVYLVAALRSAYLCEQVLARSPSPDALHEILAVPDLPPARSGGGIACVRRGDAPRGMG